MDLGKAVDVLAQALDILCESHGSSERRRGLLAPFCACTVSENSHFLIFACACFCSNSTRRKGERALECAKVYYMYGAALFSKAQEDNNVFGPVRLVELNTHLTRLSCCWTTVRTPTLAASP